MNFLKNKFDLIISIGSDCACTSYLRRCNLQYNSYPFDWLTNAPFENRIELLVNDFKDFMNFDDLEIMQKPTQINADSGHDYYMNKRNNFYFWHDFPAKTSLIDSFQEINEKYKRRIKRLYDEINQSEKILFVWLSHSKNHNIYEILSEYKKLKDKFNNKDVFLLIIENSEKETKEEYENNHVLIIHQDTISNDKKHHYDPTMGNKTNNLRIFKKIKLKTNIQQQFKRLIYKIIMVFISLIPYRKKRQSLKSKINMLFFHAKL